MPNRDAPPRAPNAPSEGLSRRYQAYFAGGLFTQHDLATNVAIKEAVWRVSKGRYELVLPQSKELRQLDRPELAAYLRNADLFQLVKADILVARFDGAELDTGAVVEFIVAKMLGKPSVIVRTDSRHLTGGGLDDPYNLMVKNWPRTVDVYVDSVIDYVRMIAEGRDTLGDSESERQILDAELATIRRSIDSLAESLVEAMNTAVELESPYPPELRRVVYEAARYAAGSGFDQLLTVHHLETTLQGLVENKTL